MEELRGISNKINETVQKLKEDKDIEKQKESCKGLSIN